MSRPQEVIGLRISASQIPLYGRWLESFGERPHWLLISRWSEEGALAHIRALPHSSARQLWLELTDLHTLAPADIEFTGWVAKGTEAGGWTGSSSAFLLAQHLAGQSRPFVVQGGIGLHSAAACRVAGAAGVVLDDQLLAMPESPLSDAQREFVAALRSEETQLVGESLGAACRVMKRANSAAVTNLVHRAAELEANSGGNGNLSLWRAEVQRLAGWNDPEQSAWPVGQSIGLAGDFAQRFKTTGRLIRAIVEGSAEHLVDAARLAALSKDSLLAQSHGVRCPIAQGPMTRVSDNSRFAAAVADAGALPFLALALMRGPQCEELLRRTRELLGERPWGVGILGFVPPELRSEQLAAMEAVRPPFALIAGGRPEQVQRLEQSGTATYVHLASPRMLELYLEQGVRRFVFEGAECGGHVGPLTSFGLWDSMVEALLRHVGPEAAADIHILFAGGIHDALSAAMTAALAAPLSARGMKIGVLMGTAYLFTQEAVACGAIVPQFQREAIDCSRTVKLTTGGGHAIRCSETPFASEFATRKRTLAVKEMLPDEVRQSLERITLGRSRVASKGLSRKLDGGLASLSEPEQHRQGMYMMGEIAALRNAALPMAELHDDVSAGSTRILASLAPKSAPHMPPPDPMRIAVIGMASHLPGASGPAMFWRNLLDRVSAIREVPQHRWDWRLYFDSNPQARDKIYSRWGAFVPEIGFDPLRYGIPPNSLSAIAIPQLLGLEMASQALQDAGYGDGSFDRGNTAVILGATNPADLQHMYVARSMLPLCADGLAAETWDRMPEWTEESLPGILMNVMAGRIANRLDLGGPNYTVDAACASSLAALSLAVQELKSGRSDMVVTGGIDLEMTPYTYLCFSKTRALSASGQASVFDESADGIVLGEGVVMLVLKRLEDAERDGDRIYGLIQAVAGSSDGRGLGITAPKSSGQQLALRRAYAAAGIDCSTLRLYEAHGTGTAAGDKAEIETVVTALREAGAPSRSCAVGSAKSLLGHTKATAGMVGLVKALLALYYKTLPPHAGVVRPLALLADRASPVCLYDEPTPWLTDAHPRRAGISAFGFGGVNFHAVAEEYSGWQSSPPAGGENWPWNLFAIQADSVEELTDQLRRLHEEAQGQLSLTQLAARWAAAIPAKRYTACVVAQDSKQLRDSIDALLIEFGRKQGGASPWGVHVRLDAAPACGDVAFLLPGQGSQYPGMLREVSVYVPEMRSAMELADRYAQDAGLTERLSRVVWPEASFNEEQRAACVRALAETRAAQLALGAVSSGLLNFLRRIGIRPQRAAGHSYGEYLALHAGGVIGYETLLALTVARGCAIAETAYAKPGGMAATAADADLLRELEDGVVVANRNAPDQVVLSGELEALQAVMRKLEKRGAACRMLPVSCAFHSPSMSAARERLGKAISDAAFEAPEIPVHGSRDGEPYPASADAMRAQLLAHLEEPVDYLAQIERLYAAGVRTFIEVGPKTVLSGLTGRILQERPHRTISLDGPDNGMKGLLVALAQAIVAGVPVNLQALYAGLSQPAAQDTAAPASAWMLDGGRIWRRDHLTRDIGVLPLLTEETVRLRALSPQRIAAPGETDQSPRLDDRAGAIVSIYHDYQETMRRFLAAQEEAVSSILNRLGNGNHLDPAVRAEPIAPRDSETVFPAPAAKTNGIERHGVDQPVAHRLTRATISDFLLETICKHTGYPKELIQLHQDLEADLGIDSLKRVEIFLTLQRHVGELTGTAMNNLFDRLEGRKSLVGILDQVMQDITTLTGISTIAAAELPISSRTGAGVPRADSCPRFVMVSEVAKAGRLARIPAKGLFLVTEDEIGVAQRLIASLQEQGVSAELIPRQTLDDLPALDRRVLSLRIVHGEVQGIVHLAALAHSHAQDVAGWKKELQVQTRTLFRLLQLCEEDIRRATSARPVKVIAATGFGGHFGRGTGAPVSVAGAGSSGLLRTLECEYSNVFAHTIDFDLDSSTPEWKAERLMKELLARGGPAETGFAGGKRLAFRAMPQPLHEREESYAWRPQPGWVVLMTGGARGITGRLRMLSGAGVRLVVVGRTPLDERDIPAEAPDLGRIRKMMAAQAQSEGSRLTPRQIEKRVRERFRAEERASNLAEFRRAGAEVDYRVCDVQDGDAFSALIDSIYAQYGRIDAVVHGAGIVEDDRLSEKNIESFDRVLETKAVSAFVLLRRLRPENLKWITLFGSVAGRFGNRGQWDYAAANEIVNRLGWQMHALWPDTRVAVLNWGPWRGVGMADESLAARFEQQGITPIEPAEGVRFFERELSQGRKGEVEVIAGNGPWSADADPLVNSVAEVSWILMQIRSVVESVGSVV